MNQKIIMQQSEASFLDIFLSQLPIFLIFLVLYYFILRPNSKKQESVTQENISEEEDTEIKDVELLNDVNGSFVSDKD